MPPLLLFVLMSGIVVLATMIGAAIWIPAWRNRFADASKSWPTTEGTVRGSGMAVVSRYEQLPSFDFSYVVNGEYYSGTFMLAAQGDRANILLKEMDEKKFDLRYDPARPSRFYIVQDTIEGCDVKFRSGASMS